MFVERLNEITQEEKTFLPRLHISNLFISYKLARFNPQCGTVIHVFSCHQPALKELFFFFSVAAESCQWEPEN